MDFLPISEFPREGIHDIISVFALSDGTPYYRLNYGARLTTEYKWIDVDADTKKRTIKREYIEAKNAMFCLDNEHYEIHPVAFCILPDPKEAATGKGE